MTEGFNINDWTKWNVIEDNKKLLALCVLCRGKIQEHKVIQVNLIKCLGCGVKKGII